MKTLERIEESDEGSLEANHKKLTISELKLFLPVLVQILLFIIIIYFLVRSLPINN
jgi:hypothetical protein